MSEVLFDEVVSWFDNFAKVPLSATEKKAVRDKFTEAGIDLEVLPLLEDADLRDFVPEQFSISRKYQVKAALKRVRG